MPQSPESRLAGLGITLPEQLAPAGAYVPTVRTGDLLFTAGQVALSEGQLVATGRLGAELDVEAGQRCARQCAINVLAQLKVATGQLLRVHRLVKVTVFVACTAEFSEQHLVANGASELFGDVLGDAGVHARSAVGVTALPLGSPVEVETVAEVA